MNNRISHLATCLLLASCADSQPIFRPVEVDVPIAAPCRVVAPAKPDFALAQTAASDDIFAKTKNALIELDQRKAYEAEIESHLVLCQ
jgi:hypothetical protein